MHKSQETIYEAARLLVKRYGEAAPARAAMKARDLISEGKAKDDGEWWLSVMAAAKSLIRAEERAA